MQIIVLFEYAHIPKDWRVKFAKALQT